MNPQDSPGIPSNPQEPPGIKEYTKPQGKDLYMALRHFRRLPRKLPVMLKSHENVNLYVLIFWTPYQPLWITFCFLTLAKVKRRKINFDFEPHIDHCVLLFAFSLKQKSREERKWKMEGNRHISLGDFRVEISYVVKQSIQGAKDQKVQGHQIFIKFVCTSVKFKRQDCLSSFRYTNLQW